MNQNTSKSLRKSAVIGALLLLAATASGCGVGMPTAPSVSDPGMNQGVQMNDLGSELEFGDIAVGGGSYEKPMDPDPEIYVPTAGGPGNSDWGHSRQRHNNPR